MCNNCQKNNCGCKEKIVNYDICNNCPDEPCSCPIKDLSTDCIILAEDLSCSGVLGGTNFTEALKQFDQFVCDSTSQLGGTTTLISLGNGAEVYKGIDGLGRREIRSILSSETLINIEENTNDISIEVNEDNLSDFIKNNQYTYSSDNIGVGIPIYKDNTVLANNTQFNFKSISLNNQTGLGQEIIRDIQNNTNDIIIRGKKINSTTLTLTSNDEELFINIPSTSSIPGLYINNLYVPTYEDFLSGNTKGLGTISKPFTDTINYTNSTTFTITPNTSVQNALDSYVGTGSRLVPQKSGQSLILQNNNTSYSFPGDFSYTNLRFILEEGSKLISTTTNKFIDMDNSLFFNQTSTTSVNITFQQGSTLEIRGLGFFNSGAASGGVRQVILEGTTGVLFSTQTDITKYLFNVMGTGTSHSACFDIRCSILANYQGIYQVERGGIDIYSNISSGLQTVAVDTNLVAFKQTGGNIRFLPGARLFVYGSSRINGFTFEAVNGIPSVEINACSISTEIVTNLFNKLSNGTINFKLENCYSGSAFGVVNYFESTNLWPLIFNSNNFSTGSIDITKADTTKSNTLSSVNTLGKYLIENLLKYNDRTAAIAAGVPINTAYIKTGGVISPTTGWLRDVVL